MSMRSADLKYMQRAYELALRGKGQTSPNPIVGAVIVKNNRVVGEGWHRRCGGPHAEIFALREAVSKARGATLYVTLEPCSHFGRTPPCVDAVLQSGIKEVVVGMKDPNPLTNGKGIAKLRRAGVKVRVGFLEKELADANASFIKFIRTKMPLVVAKSAVTLDGKVATRTGHSKWITSEEARRFARGQRNDFDGIVVGIKTVLSDDPGLQPARKDKRIWKIVLDSRLRIPLTAKILATSPADCLIATTKKFSRRKRVLLERKGAQVIVCPTKQGQVDLLFLFRELASRWITSILIEGGPHVAGVALRDKLVDKMNVYIAPKILGDEKALSAVLGLAPGDVNRAIRLVNTKVQLLGDDIFMEGDVKY